MSARNLAGQTVTFVHFELGERGQLGVRSETPVEDDVPHCRMRTLSARELAEAGFDAGLQIWKCTAPLDDVTTGIDATSYLRYGGEMFAVIGGAQIKPDLDGSGTLPGHVTVLAQKTS